VRIGPFVASQERQSVTEWPLFSERLKYAAILNPAAVA